MVLKIVKHTEFFLVQSFLVQFDKKQEHKFFIFTFFITKDGKQ